ncbi:hypothetical protein ACFQH2_08910 [Natronoarchaeum sp. GCM10025703]|uniref:hypothetical protein n=1 Tax=unclassified Natronoarchaeum TaxID=2620183 RepID=UPI003615456E
MSALGVFDRIIQVLVGLAVLVLVLGLVVDAGLLLLGGFLFIVAGIFYVGVRMLKIRAETSRT